MIILLIIVCVINCEVGYGSIIYEDQLCAGEIYSYNYIVLDKCVKHNWDRIYPIHSIYDTLPYNKIVYEKQDGTFIKELCNDRNCTNCPQKDIIYTVGQNDTCIYGMKHTFMNYPPPNNYHCTHYGKYGDSRYYTTYITCKKIN